jgi:hypothetical protein
MGRSTRSLQGFVGSGMMAVLLVCIGCTSLPDFCGQNIRRVTAIDFSGPGFINPTPGYDSATYSVTMSVEKGNPEGRGTVCYAVRDEDTGVDDVLDAYFMVFEAGETTKTLEGQFILYAKDDEDVCGTGAIEGDDKVAGCASEVEADVYIQPRETDGPNSSIHKVKVGPPPPPPGPCPSGQKCCGTVQGDKCVGECIPEMASCQ